METKKTNKGIIITLIVFIIIALVECWYILTIKKVIPDYLKIVKEEKVVEEKVEANEEVKEEPKEEVDLSFDITKCQNCDDDFEYVINDFGDFITAELINDKTVNINLRDISKFDSSIQTSGQNEYTINFDKKIRNIYIIGYGLDAANETLIYLMEDGTLEYTPIINAVKNNTIKSYGTINNVKNVVSIYNVRKDYKGPVGGSTSYLAQSSDGTLYDLANLLDKTGNYN